MVIGFLSVLQYKAHLLRLHANQPWAVQRIYAAHVLSGSPPLPRFLFLIGYSKYSARAHILSAYETHSRLDQTLPGAMIREIATAVDIRNRQRPG